MLCMVGRSVCIYWDVETFLFFSVISLNELLVARKLEIIEVDKTRNVSWLAVRMKTNEWNLLGLCNDVYLCRPNCEINLGGGDN